MRVARVTTALPLWVALIASVSTRTFGLPERVPNTTLRMPASPPANGYALANAFGDLAFTDPTAIVSAPGETNRLFVTEQAGRVAVITNLAAPTRTVFLDITSRVVGGMPTDERGLLGLAFHPGYATNRFFFVFYSTISTTPGIATDALHERLSRFQAKADDPDQADAGSEVVLINQHDQEANHNGGDLHFGPDGYLYVSVGDEGGAGDTYQNSQRIDKNFFLELTNGVAASARRLETRFLVRNSSGIYGVTYRWDSASNATLVPEEGLDETFTITEGETVRTQVWHYPSRAQCLLCHTTAAGLALGFNTPQMNRDVDYGSGPENQIAALNRAGYFSAPVAHVNTLRALASPTDAAVSVDYRVRSYLAANCAQCHQPGAVAQGNWDARVTTPLSQAGIINGTLSNNRGDPANRVIEPGSVAHSMILTRIATAGSGRMPPLDSSVTDAGGVSLLTEWITGVLLGYRSFADWQTAQFGDSNLPDAAPDADPDHDGANNLVEYLTGTDPKTDRDVWQPHIKQSGNSVEISFPQIANRGFQVESADGLESPFSWQPLDVPGNRPAFPATSSTATLADVITNGPFRFYRVRIFEP